jgi:hypothetical protein
MIYINSKVGFMDRGRSYRFYGKTMDVGHGGGKM